MPPGLATGFAPPLSNPHFLEWIVALFAVVILIFNGLNYCNYCTLVPMASFSCGYFLIFRVQQG
jgi:hypothetical protein